MSFASDTAVTPRSPGAFDAEIRPGWDIAGNTNGGVLLSTAARAILATAEQPHPISITAHYLRPGHVGPISIGTEVVKRGRQFATVRAELHQDDKPILAVLATCGDLATQEGGRYIDAHPPELPNFDSLDGKTSAESAAAAFRASVDSRLHPDDAGYVEGRPSGTPLMRGWFALPQDEPIDAIGLLLASDAFPPTIFNLLEPPAWSPTLELTVHVRAAPAPGPLRCRFSTSFRHGGLYEVDGQLWDSSDTLVALSRQIALEPKGTPFTTP